MKMLIALYVVIYGVMAQSIIPYPMALHTGDTCSSAPYAYVGVSSEGVICGCVNAQWNCAGSGGGGGSTGDAAANTAVTFSATPTFTVNKNVVQSFSMTLSNNVTSSTMNTASITASGKPIVTFYITQDSTGGRTFAWPTNVLGHGTISATASSTSVQSFQWDGTNFNSLTSMTINGLTKQKITFPGLTGATTLEASDTATGALQLPAISATLATKAGSSTTNHCAKFDSNGSVTDAGADCSAGGGSGAIINRDITFGSCKANDATAYPGMWSADRAKTVPVLSCAATGLGAPSGVSLERMEFDTSEDASLYYSFILPATATTATLKIPSYGGSGTGDVQWQVGACDMGAAPVGACSYNNATAIRTQVTSFTGKITTVTIDITGWTSGHVINLSLTRLNACTGCSNGNMSGIEYLFNPTLLTVN